MMGMRIGAERLVCTCVVTFVLTFGSGAAVGAAASPAEQARQILVATGVKGGLVVHVGCGEGKLTAALRADERYLVHGLDREAANVAKVRARAQAAGAGGKVSASQWSGERLPFTDGVVSLIVSQSPLGVAESEVMRVLAPDGVAYVRAGGGKWQKTVKPRPKQIDEWTHYLHDAGGNAVAHDEAVGPPRHMQWLAEPSWTRNHHKLASISAVVSSGGRIFYIVDEGPGANMQVPGRWLLAARDAFNGVLLWKRAMPAWAYHLKGFRSGPVQLPRTLVAGGQRVYAPLAIDAPLTALDAATGKTLTTYEGTNGVEEIVLHEGVLLVLVGSPTAEQAGIDPARRGEAKYPNRKKVIAFRAETGKELWRFAEPADRRIMPVTLAAGGGGVFFQAGTGVVCLDLEGGKELWSWQRGAKGPAGARQQADGKTRAGKKRADKKPRQRKARKPRGRSVGWSTATLVVHDGVVLWADGGKLSAVLAKTGRLLWECPARAGFRSPSDVFAIGGLVWLGPNFGEGRDLRTGEVKKTYNILPDLWTAGHHHRCYREKATDRYIMMGKRGIEFLDLAGENHSRNNWVRGTCQYGILPCNGLIYAPGHACGCFMEAKLHGFWALGPARRPRPADTSERFIEGPAYVGQGKGDRHLRSAAEPVPFSGTGNPQSGWPTLRGNARRSGSTTAAVPAQLGDVWQTKLGGRLSAPVSAGGFVVVSSIEDRRIVAMGALDGKTRWTFTAGGRVDSPPTLHEGRVLFGCADGWVYCLRLSDGELAWRFRAAPEELKTVSMDQVESVWPVCGSVLVQEGIAYAAAGRSSHLDGGMYLFGLDPATGKVLSRTRVRSEHPKAGDGKKPDGNPPVKKFVQNATDYKTFAAADKADAFSMAGATNDVLVGDGSGVFLRQMKFGRDLAELPMGRHLLSTSSLLDDAENHRSHWVLGTGDFSRTGVAYSWIVYTPGRHGGQRLSVPHGLMLSFDDRSVWAVRRAKTGGGYTLRAEDNSPFSPGEQHQPDFRDFQKGAEPKPRWSARLGMRPRAMVRAGDVLLLGGMASELAPGDPYATFEGRAGGLLWTVSAADGSKVAERKLPSPPVWDGLAVAGGRVYASTQDGRVICLGGKAR